jgi:imidazolonepropionase-like amidohydrolase
VDETRAYPVLFLANGVTTTFPAGEVDPDSMRELRLAIDRGDRVGPRIVNSGPYFGGARRGWDPDLTPDEIRAEVDRWAARGIGGFKAKGITADHLRPLIDQAHLHGLTVTGHLGSGYRGSVNPRDAILMGIDRVEHFLGGDALTADRSAYESLEELSIDTPEFRSIVELYIRHGVHFDATVTAYGYFGARDPRVFTYFHDEKKYLTPYVRERLEAREPRPVNERFERIYRVKLRTVKAFHDAGGADLITLGTDHPSWGEYFSGFSVHREMHALALAGIPPAAVLKIATSNGARAIGRASYQGTIEPGKLADLVVVEGNPTADIRNTRNVRLVMKAGRVYDPEALLRSVEGTIGPAGPAEVERWMPVTSDQD